MQELQKRLTVSSDKETFLVHAVRLTRLIGDAFAWVLLRGDEQFITPLTENQPTGRVPSGPGLTGVLAVAVQMSDEGAGFPILHDMTSILRIGDITFVRPNHGPATVEVKTRLEHDGPPGTQFSVHVIAPTHSNSPGVFAHLPTVRPEDTDAAPSATVRKTGPRSTPGLRRQLDRMSRAARLQRHRDSEVLDLDGQQHLRVVIDRWPGFSHWDVVAEVAKEAKIVGYASREVDGAFLYVAVYGDTLLFTSPSEPMSQMGEQLASDLLASQILSKEVERNYIWVGQTWSHLLGEAPPTARPLLLYPLDLDAVLDLMSGRLGFFVVVNLGRLVESLQAEGFETSLPKNQVDVMRVFLRAERHREESHFKADNLWPIGQKLIFDFLSRAGFVRHMVALADAAAAIAREERPKE